MVGWVARVLLVLLLVAAVLAPWLWLIEQRLPGYLLNTLHKEIFLRGTQAAEGHTGPPGFYLLTVWGTFFPWCLLLPAALVLGWRHRANPPLRFALAAVVGPWLFLEIYVTKLPHYLVSTFPFLSLLVADLVVRTRRRMVDETSDRGFRIGVAVWRGAVLLLAIGAFAVLFIEMQPPIVLVGLLILSAIAFEYGRIVHRAMLARRMTIAAVVMGLGTWLVVLVAHSLILPNLGFLQISPRIAALLREDGATDQPDVRMIDYKEPSLGFYRGGSIREETDDQFLVHAPPEQWPRWLVITDEQFRRAPDAVQDRWTLLGAVDGIAYADGMRNVRVLALRRRD
jgi:4-amino-4-deoxy-L-arabinose transferase-like glycosyltransferase